jgi:hypothetical protein
MTSGRQILQKSSDAKTSRNRRTCAPNVSARPGKGFSGTTVKMTVAAIAESAAAQ